MTSAQLINQTSGKTEWFTPGFILDAARAVMGGIDLDPASCLEANARVKAADFFTDALDGLSSTWFGRVWLNHPFGPDNAKWIEKLVSEYRSGRVSQALCITYACTSERWFQPLMDFPQCFLFPRTNYVLPADGTGMQPNGRTTKGVTKGSVVTYLPPGGGDKHAAQGVGAHESFAHYFRRYGKIKIAL